MTREELEHIIRASADVTNQYEFVIVGSQSMLGPVPRPEPEFTVDGGGHLSASGARAGR